MIKIEGLNFIYGENMPFSHTALKNINLEIPSGEFVALIGHTGSGKSTLIQHLNALVKPTSGRILIDGEDITKKDADLKKIRQKVGLVFQYPEHQLFEETVYKDIAFGPTNMGLSEDEVAKRVKKAAELVGIGHELLEKSPFELSGGQKRRVAIAGVLAMEPEVLILDEPTAGLDPKGRDKILKLLKNIHESNKNITIIFVSHSMEDVAKLANYVVVLSKGEVAMTGSVREVFARGEELKKIGLDVPRIAKLSNELKKEGIDILDGVYTPDEAFLRIIKKIREVSNA